MGILSYKASTKRVHGQLGKLNVHIPWAPQSSSLAFITKSVSSSWFKRVLLLLSSYHNLNHSPEIDYLEDGVNSILGHDANSDDTFTQAVLEILSNEGLNIRLRSGGRITAQQYTRSDGS
jgi:hypothetical protein